MHLLERDAGLLHQHPGPHRPRRVVLVADVELHAVSSRVLSGCYRRAARRLMRKRGIEALTPSSAARAARGRRGRWPEPAAMPRHPRRRQDVDQRQQGAQHRGRLAPQPDGDADRRRRARGPPAVVSPRTWSLAGHPSGWSRRRESPRRPRRRGSRASGRPARCQACSGTSTNSAEPRATRMWVRTPAALPRCSRSKPQQDAQQSRQQQAAAGRGRADSTSATSENSAASVAAIRSQALTDAVRAGPCWARAGSHRAGRPCPAGPSATAAPPLSTPRSWWRWTAPS